MTGCTTSDEENQAASINRYKGESSFIFKNYTRTHIDGAFVRFNLTANELTKRQRNGRIVKFIDYDELYFRDLIIDQPLNTKIVKLEMNEVASFLDSNSIAAENSTIHADYDNNSSTADNSTKHTDLKVLGNRINRILADRVKINFKPSKKKPIILTASHAKMLTDTMVIQFDGKVSLNANKCKLTSEVAVWSNVYGGLFFSASYFLNDKKYDTPAFYQITEAGRCQKLRSVKFVEYVDVLDAIEDKVFESMPMDIRFLFGLLGTSTPIEITR